LNAVDSSMNYTPEELQLLGIQVGVNPLVHRTVLFFNPSKISLGHNVRIDCYSVLSAGEDGIEIGRNVHIAASSLLFGSGGRIQISDFAGLSSRVSVYTATDDYLEGYLTNPTVPSRYKKVKCGPVVLERHALVGSGCVILPGVVLRQGCAVGAMSLVNRDIGSYDVVFGVPNRVIGRRDSEQLKRLESEYLQSEGKVIPN
jgi:acetyltransferase-like isoleucine patch superfamily enzyme